MDLRWCSIRTRLAGAFALLFILLAVLAAIVGFNDIARQDELARQLASLGQGIGRQELQAIAKIVAEAEAARTMLLQYAAGGAVLVAALAGAVAWLVGRSITHPLEAALSLARRVATGDLSSDIAAKGKDEISDLLRALQAMNGNLKKIVGDVRVGTQVIAEASDQIADGNSALSSRTESQASSLQQTASSMEQLTSMVSQNAGHAEQANQVVAVASGSAVRGGKVVEQVRDIMGAINDSSTRIVDIISVIDGIAFQTNILALNASVEAARAGEQGRGFAVVASEVRSLAQRSAVAAREIKVLIDESVQKVKSGNLLAGQAEGAMHDIVRSVAQVEGIIAEISQAGREQSHGITEINHAVAQMDKMTQQNALLVENAASSALKMQQLATSLAQSVAAFRLENSSDAAIAMVKRAVRHVQANGTEAALADFSLPAPEFRQRDLYINAIDLNGNTLAHGDNKKLIGRNLIDMKDADGKPFIRHFVETAKSAGQGWVDYRWQNPVTGLLEEKRTYIELVDGLVLGCGVYK
ncbi:methyl-accepting chemotaxis protein [Herbaspirillum chlorophenolicum]|uniref:Methyl-accepting chemotaxis protein n=1 Tax=Herbaspirillum chlorophenolicum TaxID=211589 RepID=A0ABW8EVC4_9BURK|nr:methyl-accepting chemotaxis protein [Herbaspirillum chlorophenolicum]